MLWKWQKKYCLGIIHSTCAIFCYFALENWVRSTIKIQLKIIYWTPVLGQALYQIHKWDMVPSSWNLRLENHHYILLFQKILLKLSLKKGPYLRKSSLEPHLQCEEGSVHCCCWSCIRLHLHQTPPLSSYSWTKSQPAAHPVGLVSPSVCWYLLLFL